MIGMSLAIVYGYALRIFSEEIYKLVVDYLSKSEIYIE